MNESVNTGLPVKLHRKSNSRNSYFAPGSPRHVVSSRQVREALRSQVMLVLAERTDSAERAREKERACVRERERESACDSVCVTFYV